MYTRLTGSTEIGIYSGHKTNRDNNHKLMKHIATLLIGASMTCALHAQSTPAGIKSVNEYVAVSRVQLFACKLKMQVALTRFAGSKPEDDPTECVKNAKTIAKEDFSAALNALTKESAKTALKEFHVSFITALDGIEPGPGERKISYEVRQQQLDQKFTEARVRLEVEL